MQIPLYRPQNVNQREYLKTTLLFYVDNLGVVVHKNLRERKASSRQFSKLFVSLLASYTF